MDNALRTYETFQDPEQTSQIATVLKKGGISVSVEDDHGLTDFTKPLDVLSQAYRIKIPSHDFERADELLNAYYESVASSTNSDYFLFDFSDEDLVRVVWEPQEWGRFNTALAKMILQQRGVSVSPVLAKAVTKQRLEAASAPENPNHNWVLFGYISALFGGIIGILIGWHLNTSRKTLSTGNLAFSYSATDRRHGLRIFALGCIMFLALAAFRLISNPPF